MMKTRGLKDLYLPKKLAIHVKIILSAFVIGLVWGYIIKAELNFNYFISIGPILIFDLEIAFLLISSFKKLSKKYAHRLNEISSVNKLVFFKSLGHLLFLVLFMIVNIIGFSLYLIISHFIKGWGFPDLVLFINESNIIRVSALALLCAIPLFLFQNWFETLKREFKLKEQNLVFQNETLKNQVNPHFLFNSLNTLSSLVNTEVEVAGQFIARLSVIYRYILDNSSKLEVPLKEEIEFVRDYYYLHQIRNEGKIKLEVDISNDEYAYKIIPISLQLLIENAIKHNMATQDKPLIINVYIEGQKIVVSNKIQKMATQVVSTKIGLKNLNERVSLHTGKEIIVSVHEGSFFVKVPLIV